MGNKKPSTKKVKSSPYSSSKGPASRPREKRRSARLSGRKKTGNSVMVAAISVVVIAGVAAVAASITSQRRAEEELSPTRSVVVDGESLPPMPADSSQPDPAAGMVIPTVNGSSFDGNPVSISPSGKAKVILFLAHWCPHCQAEVPRLVKWMQDDPPPENVEIVAVSTAVRRGGQNYPPQRWLEREGWKAPVMADDDKDSARTAFGVEGYPTIVVVSSEGKVIMRASGEATQEQWKAMLSTASKA